MKVNTKCIFLAFLGTVCYTQAYCDSIEPIGAGWMSISDSSQKIIVQYYVSALDSFALAMPIVGGDTESTWAAEESQGSVLPIILINRTDPLNHSEGNIRLKPFNDGRTCIAMNKNTLLLMNVQPLFICNSGGPLISADNNAIGILSAGNIDIHFARFISSSHILEVFSKDDCCREALIEYEKSRYL